MVDDVVDVLVVLVEWVRGLFKEYYWMMLFGVCVIENIVYVIVVDYFILIGVGYL